MSILERLHIPAKGRVSVDCAFRAVKEPQILVTAVVLERALSGTFAEPADRG